MILFSTKDAPFGLSNKELADAYTQAATRPPGMPRHVAYLHIVESILSERKLAGTAGILPLVRQYENARISYQNLAMVSVPLVLEAEKAGVGSAVVGAVQSELHAFYTHFFKQEESEG